MKNLFTFFLLFCTITLCAQEADRFTENNSDRPHDPRTDMMNFVPNEVLIKFKDDVTINSGTQLKSAGISSVDQILKANGVASLEKLFPAEKKLKSAQILKDPTGRDMKIPSLHNIYKITIPQLKSTGSAPANIFKFMEELKALPEVEYTEPNYVFTIGDFKPAGREMTMLEAIEKMENSELSKTASGLVPNDPLYNSQWGIPATNIDDVWNTTTGDAASVIAILDTGVDWQHPDLAANIWENKQEIPGNGRDDDGNGLIDDIRGWDYINNDNNPMDDNSHGTHVAGIAAAVGNNGIGIAGVNWSAKIMPIKVFQSSGRGDAATIAKGITYAASKGATVINMSFGLFTESITLKNTLANAYITSVLVAAAGNDAKAIGMSPMFPAAYSFILGVEANTSSGRVGFTNYDNDGPVFSRYIDLLNYELKAPGTGILSCVPGGNYREYNGSSMAAPLVAGAVSLYRKQKPNESQEMLFGNFINSINLHFDLEASLNIIPVPKLNIVSYEVSDNQYGDHNGRLNAGETIELKVKVRNTWLQANDVKVGIEFGEFEDQTTATILTPEASIGSVSAYATKENAVALKIKLAANISDGRDIVFNLKTWYGNNLGEKSQQVILNVENGVELKGIISKNLTLNPNRHYIITDNIVIPEGVTLTIKPGTVLKFGEKKGLTVLGNLNAIGTRDSLIIFTKQNNGSNWNSIKLESFCGFNFNYCIIQYAGNASDWGQYIFTDNSYLTNNIIKNTQFLNNGILPNPTNSGFRIKSIQQCCFYYNAYGIYGLTSPKMTGNNIIANYNTADLYWGAAVYMMNPQSCFNNIFLNFNNRTGNETNIVNQQYSNFSIVKLDSNYYGTTNEIKINDAIYDFSESGAGPWYDISNKMNRPSRVAHGIVWKVVVNDKDAQDEFDQMDPLGVGRQKFEVFFNRAMDPNYPPIVSLGVRYPYSQTAISEQGSWSPDSTIYIVYATIGITTGDGINTIRVAGAKDMDHFEIPIEDRRFRVLVKAAGSASIEFQATAGLGKVNLEWNNDKLEDGLGFNMYRMEHVNVSVLTKPIMINSTLITDTLYTDFSVTPNKKYYYYYKIVRTNLTETDSSKVVGITPLTSSKGDANGDLMVNVLDITTIAAYLLNNNPQPFIVEAADVNSDGSINLLDIVVAVNLVLGNKSAVISINQPVHLYMQNDTLFADAPVAIGGIQFDISGATSVEEIQKLKALEGFESGYRSNEKGLRLIYYSLSGKTIPAGNRIPLLKLKKGSGILSAIFGDKTGSSIPVNYLATGVWNLSDNLNKAVAELGQNFPNPLTKNTIIPIHINEPVDEAVIRIMNVMGQEVDVIHINNPTIGEHLLNWNSGANKGLLAYLLEIRRGNQRFICPVKKMVVR